MMEILSNLDLGTIITIVVSLLATFLGGFWIKAKGKLTTIIALIGEVMDLITALNNALKDNKIDKKELEEIKNEFNELKLVFKDLIGK